MIKNVKRHCQIFGIALTILLTATLQSCSMQYSFSGASVNYATTKTFSVAYFNNLAAMVTPTLSPTLTDELVRRLVTQTKLTQVREEGDLAFSGEITDYSSDPVAVSGNEYAIKNRLTVTVKVKFTNKADPQFNFEKTYRAYEDYDTNILLTTAEQTLIPQIVEKLVEDIFNDALSNW